VFVGEERQREARGGCLICTAMGVCGRVRRAGRRAAASTLPEFFLQACINRRKDRSRRAARASPERARSIGTCPRRKAAEGSRLPQARPKHSRGQEADDVTTEQE